MTETVSRPQTLSELVTTLKAKGFTHTLTMGPVLALDDWNPYGMSPGGTNYREGDEPYMGEIIERNGETVVRDYPKDGKLDSPFVLGCWKFTTINPEG